MQLFQWVRSQSSKDIDPLSVRQRCIHVASHQVEDRRAWLRIRWEATTMKIMRLRSNERVPRRSGKREVDPGALWGQAVNMRNKRKTLNQSIASSETCWCEIDRLIKVQSWKSLATTDQTGGRRCFRPGRLRPRFIPGAFTYFSSRQPLLSIILCRSLFPFLLFKYSLCPAVINLHFLSRGALIERSTNLTLPWACPKRTGSWSCWSLIRHFSCLNWSLVSFWQFDRMRPASDCVFLGYAVHSLALVADSFHMVRHHLQSCSLAESNPNSWMMSYPYVSDYGPWRLRTGRRAPTPTPMA